MGRTPTGKAPIQSIALIREKHLEIIRRLIAGESQRKIALDIGMTEARLSVIRNSPLFKRKYAEMEAEVRARFIEKTSSVAEEVNNKVKELQPKAINTLETLLKDEKINGMKISPALKRDVALDVLDLGGNGKKAKEPSKGDAMSDVIQIIKDGFALAKANVEAQKRRNDVVNPGAIDVTPRNVNVINTDIINTTAEEITEEITDDIDIVDVTPKELTEGVS
jgi:hypothetical protein